MESCTIIANRGSGGFSRSLLDAACSRIEGGGFSVTPICCSDFAEMTEIARTLTAGREKPVIIAAGGDGTIHAVFNGLAGNGATCGILPMGTANVLAIELNISSTENAVTRILSGTTRPFTAGRISSDSKTGRFFLMAGVGFDGQIVRGVTLGEKKLLGKAAYALSALRSFASWDGGELEITTESETFSCGSLIICNASRYGGSFTLAPATDIFSPAFELIAVNQGSRRGLLKAIAYAVTSRGESTALRRSSAKRIRITGNRPVQTDGDYWGDSPLEIAAEPDYARIVL